MITNENVKIKTLPDNGNSYLVLNYGAAVKLKNKSRIPNIQVILRKIDISTNTIISNSEDIIAYVSLSELDAVKIGSIWKRQKLVNRVWTEFDNIKYEQNLFFRFILENKEPEIITYDETINELNASLYDIYKVNLLDITKGDKNRINIVKKTKYTKFIDENGLIILIPCMELFVGTYTPESKHIRERLLQYDMDTAITPYIISEKCYIDQNKYMLTLKKNNLGAENMWFIGYIKFNKISRERVNKLWNSLEFETNDLDMNSPVRYPSVLPYHPDKLEINVNGVWLNEKVFLIQRINNRQVPREYIVATIKDTYNVNIIEKGKKLINPKDNIDENKENNNENREDENDPPIVIEEVKDGDLELDSNNEPGTRNFTQKIMSEVGLLGEELKIEHTVNYIDYDYVKPELVESEDGETQESGVDKKEVLGNSNQELSSGDNRSNDEKEVKHLHIEKEYSSVETENLFLSVIKSLKEIQDSEESFEFKILDTVFNEKDRFINTNFYKTIIGTKNIKKVDSWYYLKRREDGRTIDMGYRQYLLLQIKWKDMFYFILEIGKKRGEGYSGLVFKYNNEANTEKLLELLNIIVINKGVYAKWNKSKKTMVPIDLGVEFVTYKHSIDKAGIYKNLKSKIKDKLTVLKEKI